MPESAGIARAHTGHPNGQSELEEKPEDDRGQDKRGESRSKIVKKPQLPIRSQGYNPIQKAEK